LKEKYDTTLTENDEEEIDDSIEENSTEPGTKTLDLFQGVFVNPRHRDRLAIGRRRQDSGEDESTDIGEADWVPGRNQWEWWRRLQAQKNYSN